jgi:hypothetical protein
MLLIITTIFEPSMALFPSQSMAASTFTGFLVFDCLAVNTVSNFCIILNFKVVKIINYKLSAKQANKSKMIRPMDKRAFF